MDKEAYLSSLELMYRGSRNLQDVNIRGQWGHEENKAPWLYAFDYDKHIRPTLAFYPSYDVHLSFDFNRDPVSCVAVQYSPNMGTPDSFIHFIREFGGKMQLEELCLQIRTAFPNSIFRVTGDSSGNKGDVAYKSQHDTPYTLIRGYLNLSQAQMEANTSNLLHGNSRYLCNAMFANYPKLYLSQAGCPNLIADCQMATPDEKSKNPHELKKDRGQFKMDYFDGMRYWFQRYAYDFAKLAYLKVQK
jgi:phage terminase large subunit